MHGRPAKIKGTESASSSSRRGSGGKGKGLTQPDREKRLQEMKK